MVESYNQRAVLLTINERKQKMPVIKLEFLVI